MKLMFMAEDAADPNVVSKLFRSDRTGELKDFMAQEPGFHELEEVLLQQSMVKDLVLSREKDFDVYGGGLQPGPMDEGDIGYYEFLMLSGPDGLVIPVRDMLMKQRIPFDVDDEAGGNYTFRPASLIEVRLCNLYEQTVL